MSRGASKCRNHFNSSSKPGRSSRISGGCKTLEGNTDDFLRIASMLGRRQGPILFQLPPNFKKDVPRLDAFLNHLDGRAKAAFEFRHESWLDEEVYACLRAHSVGAVRRRRRGFAGRRSRLHRKLGLCASARGGIYGQESSQVDRQNPIAKVGTKHTCSSSTKIPRPAPRWRAASSSWPAIEELRGLRGRFFAWRTAARADTLAVRSPSDDHFVPP